MSGGDSRRKIILTTFFAHAIAGGGFFTRIPDIQTNLALSEATLGAALTALPVASLATNVLAGRIIGAIGTCVILFVGVPLLGIGAALAAGAPNLPTLVAALILAGGSFSLANVAMNVEADRVEADTGRRVMARCHGLWSAGMLVSALIGVVARGYGISAFAHLAAVALAVVALSALVLARLVASPPRGSAAPTAKAISVPTRRTFVLMLFGVSGSIVQIATQSWSVIYLRDIFGSAPWVQSLSLPAFLGAMTAGRLIADGWTERFGPPPVARGLTLLAVAGGVMVVLAPNVPMALAGFALLGFGTGVHFPLMITAAADSPNRPAAESVSSVILSMGLVMLVVPGGIGLIAETIGLRAAFAAVVPPLLLTIILSGRLVRPSPPPAPHPEAP